MNLNRQEVAQFYRVWWSLLGYTNNKYKCVKEFNARTLGDHVSLSDAIKIRKKLVEDKCSDNFTEHDAKTVKFGANQGTDVGYYLQSIVDSKNKLILTYDVINNSVDQRRLYNMSKKAKDIIILKTS